MSSGNPHGGKRGHVDAKGHWEIRQRYRGVSDHRIEKLALCFCLGRVVVRASVGTQGASAPLLHRSCSATCPPAPSSCNGTVRTVQYMASRDASAWSSSASLAISNHLHQPPSSSSTWSSWSIPPRHCLQHNHPLRRCPRQTSSTTRCTRPRDFPCRLLPRSNPRHSTPIKPSPHRIRRPLHDRPAPAVGLPSGRDSFHGHLP